MSEALVAKVIEKKLATWGDQQDVKVAFEGVAFTPPKAIYARVRHLPATTTGAFVDGALKTFTGLWQITISCPKGQGIGPGRAVAMTLSAAFAPNSVLVDGAFRLQITGPVSLGPVIEDPESAKTARLNIPCSIPYRADVVS